MSCGATFTVLNGGEKEQTKDKETEFQQITKQLERRISVPINFLNEFAMRRHFCSDF